ncbi:glycosyltransferase family 2 protein [Geomesophilobacter sediminis]|uniref:Glycosyltransferase n=1 Tax=Geomesophilobacter sediminis TaxID=2798584 RepID=A0A8J7M1Q7_9BACT|nr:glycosyltransferase family 2 protein [Geomesophilobacter sediminis]MBJ6727032.1 glycosyltransferase [Geomesophilobacter sediminis]
MKLTVITPVYNGERFIRQCLDNVIAQDCPGVEHLVLDGCSKDGTVAILEEYATRYPHLRWISEPDQGQSDAMNKGIRLAAGEVISFLNVDDFYESGALRRVVELFRTLPEPSLLVGNCKVIDDDGALLFINKPARLKLAELLVGPEVNPWPINPAAYFYHRSLHGQVGPYDVNEHYALDLEFLLRAVQKAQVRYVDETFGYFRLIRGTKTFSDWEAGSNVGRCQTLLLRYRKDLPPLLRHGFPVYRLGQKLRHWSGYVVDPKRFFEVLSRKIERKIRKVKRIA